jgi:hypothetical protein
MLGIRRKKENFLLSRPWSVYKIKNFGPSDFVNERINKLLPNPQIALLENSETIKSAESNRGFFYNGHGDETCVYRSLGFTFGMKNPLCDLAEMETWNFNPFIFWACSSANWLKKGKKKNWLGFKNYIGYDCRNKKERRWWQNHLHSVLGVVLAVGEGAQEQDKVFATTQKGYVEARTRYQKKKNSYLTVLFAAALHEEIRMGDDFGKSR